MFFFTCHVIYVIRKSYVAKFLEIFSPRVFLARVCVFEQNCIYRSSDILLMPKFFQKIFVCINVERPKNPG